MRAVVQRVSSASVCINGGETREIEAGLVILLGVREGDDITLCKKLAEKCAHLRIFHDEDGKMNRSAVELSLQALVVSNFTLYADTKKGKRPSFIKAAKEPLSVDCYECFVQEIQKQGLASVETGTFGAEMQVKLLNDGPVTLMLDTDEWQAK